MPAKTYPQLPTLAPPSHRAALGVTPRAICQGTSIGLHRSKCRSWVKETSASSTASTPESASSASSSTPSSFYEHLSATFPHHQNTARQPRPASSHHPPSRPGAGRGARSTSPSLRSRSRSWEPSASFCPRRRGGGGGGLGLFARVPEGSGWRSYTE